jgi:hypothetical protein
MDYTKMMRWNKKHPKGTRQPVLMHTGSGFWPAWSWLEHDYFPYHAACEAVGVKALDQESYYKKRVRGGDWCGYSAEVCAERTRVFHAETHKLGNGE